MTPPFTQVMELARRLPLAWWLGYWRMSQLYHRYTVEGLHHLDGKRSMLIVGYHGRPLAFDMCMLTVALHDRLGYLPHGVVHRSMAQSPLLSWSNDALGFVTGDGEGMRRAIAKGEHIMTTPGGGLEGCRNFLQRYRVRWNDHIGYLRLARKYRLPIVPVAAAGADDTYIGLVDADAVGRLLGLSGKWAWLLWVGVGPLGLYPFSPPFPVQLRQLIGPPIDPWAANVKDDDNDDALLRIHSIVVHAVQDLLDQARETGPWRNGRRTGRAAGR